MRICIVHGIDFGAKARFVSDRISSRNLLTRQGRKTGQTNAMYVFFFFFARIFATEIISIGHYSRLASGPSDFQQTTLQAAKTENLSGPHVPTVRSRPQDVALRNDRHGHWGILNESAVPLGPISLSFFVLPPVSRLGRARACTRFCGPAISAPDSGRTYWPDFWSRWNFQR